MKAIAPTALRAAAHVGRWPPQEPDATATVQSHQVGVPAGYSWEESDT